MIKNIYLLEHGVSSCPRMKCGGNEASNHRNVPHITGRVAAISPRVETTMHHEKNIFLQRPIVQILLSNFRPYIHVPPTYMGRYYRYINDMLVTNTLLRFS